MVFVLIGLVILFLATVIGVLVTGVTVAHRAEVRRRAAGPGRLLQAEGATGEAAAPYINALIAAGTCRRRASRWRRLAAVVSATAPAPDLDLAEARLFSADEGVREGRRARRQGDEGLQGRVRRAGRAEAAKTRRTPRAPASSADYYNAALVKAYALVELGRWKDAVAAFDIYIRREPDGVRHPHRSRERQGRAEGQGGRREGLPRGAQIRAVRRRSKGRTQEDRSRAMSDTTPALPTDAPAPARQAPPSAARAGAGTGHPHPPARARALPALQRRARADDGRSRGKPVDTRGIKWVRSIYGTSNQPEGPLRPDPGSGPGRRRDDLGHRREEPVEHHASSAPTAATSAHSSHSARRMPISAPSRIAIGPDGRVYICETTLDRIHVL